MIAVVLYASQAIRIMGHSECWIISECLSMLSELLSPLWLNFIWQCISWGLSVMCILLHSRSRLQDWNPHQHGLLVSSELLISPNPLPKHIQREYLSSLYTHVCILAFTSLCAGRSFPVELCPTLSGDVVPDLFQPVQLCPYTACHLFQTLLWQNLSSHVVPVMFQTVSAQPTESSCCLGSHVYLHVLR